MRERATATRLLVVKFGRTQRVFAGRGKRREGKMAGYPVCMYAGLASGWLGSGRAPVTVSYGLALRQTRIRGSQLPERLI